MIVPMKKPQSSPMKWIGQSDISDFMNSGGQTEQEIHTKFPQAIEAMLSIKQLCITSSGSRQQIHFQKY